MASILNLPHWAVTNVTETPGQYVVEAAYTQPPTGCVHCGSVTNVHKHGTKKQEITDLPSHANRVRIVLTRTRHWCKDCGKTFLQPLPDVADSGSMTNRLVRYIERQSLKHTFAHVAEEVGLDEKTIRNIFNAYTDWLDKNVVFETPEVLGLDELFLLGKARCVAVNVREATLVGVMEDRNKATVHEFLFWLRDKEKVRLVTMDMYRPYRDAVRACLPGAKVVVDKFHIVRMATQALESVRRRLREDMTATRRRQVMRSRFLALKRNRDLSESDRALLAEWTNTLPALGKAYALKESYYDIFDMKSRADAVKAYDAWQATMPDDMRPAFKDLTTAMTNWREEVFDIIEYGVSNATVEAINGLSKMTNRQGRGYSFRAIRAKMLFNKHVQFTEARKAAAAQALADMDLLHDEPGQVDARDEHLDELIERGDPIPAKDYGPLIDHLWSVLVEQEVQAAAPPAPTPTPKSKRSRPK